MLKPVNMILRSRASVSRILNISRKEWRNAMGCDETEQVHWLKSAQKWSVKDENSYRTYKFFWKRSMTVDFFIFDKWSFNHQEWRWYWFCTMKYNKVSARDKSISWWSPEVKAALRDRNKALNQFRKISNFHDLTNYKRFRARTRCLLHSVKKQSWNIFVARINHFLLRYVE